MKKQLVTILLLCAPIALFAQKEISKTFGGVKSVRITTASGNCRILKSADATVTIGVRHAFDESEFEPVLAQDGDRLELKENYKAQSVSGTSPVWTMSIPEGIEVRFRTGSGSIEAASMKLQLDVNTGSGSVTFTR